MATVRTYLQLIALGLRAALGVRVDSPWLVIAMLVLMVLMAAQIIVKRSPDAPPAHLRARSVLAMVVTGFVVTFAVTGLIVQVEPWYLPRYVIPLAGMVLGNSMTGIALALERVFADLDLRDEELLALIALGATPWEAAHSSVRDALRAGLMPTISSMAAADRLHPGDDGRADTRRRRPVAATGYQIVVMLMVAAATALGSVIALLLTYRRRFSRRGSVPRQGPAGRYTLEVSAERKFRSAALRS